MSKWSIFWSNVPSIAGYLVSWKDQSHDLPAFTLGPFKTGKEVDEVLGWRYR